MNSAVGVSSLIVMSAIERLGDNANGLAVADMTGLSESSVYNITSRLVSKGLLESKRSFTTQYTLTKDGKKCLEEVREAIS